MKFGKGVENHALALVGLIPMNCTCNPVVHEGELEDSRITYDLNTEKIFSIYANKFNVHGNCACLDANDIKISFESAEFRYQMVCHEAGTLKLRYHDVGEEGHFTLEGGHTCALWAVQPHTTEIDRRGRYHKVASFQINVRQDGDALDTTTYVGKIKHVIALNKTVATHGFRDTLNCTDPTKDKISPTETIRVGPYDQTTLDEAANRANISNASAIKLTYNPTTLDDAASRANLTNGSALKVHLEKPFEKHRSPQFTLEYRNAATGNWTNSLFEWMMVCPNTGAMVASSPELEADTDVAPQDKYNNVAKNSYEFRVVATHPETSKRYVMETFTIVVGENDKKWAGRTGYCAAWQPDQAVDDLHRSATVYHTYVLLSPSFCTKHHAVCLRKGRLDLIKL